jgi:hypothetical protein
MFAAPSKDAQTRSATINGQSDFGQAGGKRVLPSDESCASSRAALLAVIVGELNAFVADAIDVRRAIAHLAIAESADVPHADIVAPKDQNIRLLCSHALLLLVSSRLRLGLTKKSPNGSLRMQHQRGFLPTVTCYKLIERPNLFSRESNEDPPKKVLGRASQNLKERTFVAWRPADVLGTVKTDRNNENRKSAALRQLTLSGDFTKDPGPVATG